MTLSISSKKETAFFTQDQINLIKNYLCKGISDDELHFFHAVCKKTGLDPFMKQIYAVKRKDQMTIQTSIDGHRLIAERTGKYSPGREPSYQYDKDGKLISATSYIKKMTSDGTWHEVGASAFWDEYVQYFYNKDTRIQEISKFWKQFGHVMLAKCAEALALRKAFPNELSGLYSEEEMHQATNVAINATLTDEQFQELSNLFDKCSPEYQEKFNDWMIAKKFNSIQNIPENMYVTVKKLLSEKSSEYQLFISEKTGTEVFI